MKEDIHLVLSDCLPFMENMQQNSVALVCADLPYGVTKCHWDICLDLTKFWAAINHCTVTSSVAVLTATFRFAIDLAQSNPKEFKYELIWLKKRATGFMRAKKAPLRSHELALVFAKSGHTYNPQKVPGKKNTTTTRHQKGNIFNNKNANLAKHISTDRYPQSSIVVDESDLRYDHLNGRKGGRLHPTQKPVALMEWFLKSYSREGEIVLDPCAGSGTTAIAAINSNRKIICIENNPKYFEVMTDRVLKHAQLAGKSVRITKGMVSS